MVEYVIGFVLKKKFGVIWVRYSRLINVIIWAGSWDCQTVDYLSGWIFITSFVYKSSIRFLFFKHIFQINFI